MKDGTELKARVDYPKGDPENPATAEELYDKFRELAGMTLPREKVNRLLDALGRLEGMENVRRLTEMSVK